MGVRSQKQQVLFLGEMQRDVQTNHRLFERISDFLDEPLRSTGPGKDGVGESFTSEPELSQGGCVWGRGGKWE
jgi:hypothetical protein